MNNKVHIDQEILKLLYFKYKNYVLPLFGFVLSWYLFFQFVVPQIQNFLAIKDTVVASEQTLAVLTQNYNTIATLDGGKLQQLLDIANHALPSTKDFAGILDAIALSANMSGVVVNDYSFQVGDINSTAQVGQVHNPGIQLSLSIKGDINQTKQFLTALADQLPLSEVTGVTIGDSSTAISANFFYDALPKIAFVDTSPLSLLTASQKKMLENLANNAQSQVSSIGSTLPTPSLSGTPVSSTSSQ